MDFQTKEKRKEIINKYLKPEGIIDTMAEGLATLLLVGIVLLACIILQN